MTPSLPEYTSYKDIGEPWIGQVPSHWGVERGKRLFMKAQRPARSTDETVTCFRDGVVTLRKNRRLRGFTEALKEIGYQGVRRGDLVIHAMDAFAGAVGVSDSDGKCSPVYQVCLPRGNANAKYYAFLVREMSRSQWIMALAKGIRERSTDFRFETFGNQFLPVPPASEQAAIVRYLAAIDRKVNRFIRGKRRMIEALNEQKRGIIKHAITKGLNPEVKLKPTGVDWLGCVPEHWDVNRLKWVVRLQRGYDLPADKRASGGTVPVYSSGGMIGTHDLAMATAPGVVIGRYGSTEAVFFVEQDYWPHNTALFTTTMYGNHARWCYYVLRSISKADHAGKSAVPGVDRKDLYDIFVPRPPLREQQALAAGIDERLRELEAATAAVLREIDLIREYRTRLVADVVTGKVDVRAAAASLPPETEELVDAIPDDDSGDEDVEVESVEEAADVAQ